MPSTIVLITGANSGVGYATTKVLVSASEDYHVIMTGRSLEKVEAAKAELEAIGIKGKLSALQLDVTQDESIGLAAEAIDKEFGRLDVLINNAGVATHTPNIKTRDRYETTFATNVFGPIVIAQAFRPLLLKSANPYSIFVSSGLGSMGMASDPSGRYYRAVWPDSYAYKASKAALNMIALQEHVVSENTPLKVFAVCPGFVVSNLRGTSEKARNPGGAGDPLVSGETIRGVIEGKRDADRGKFVHKDGVYEW